MFYSVVANRRQSNLSIMHREGGQYGNKALLVFFRIFRGEKTVSMPFRGEGAPES